MKYLICYDITSPKRLAKVATLLEQKGIRTQLSFFSCELDENELHELESTLVSLIDLKVDKLALYRVCEKCFSSGVYIGCDVSSFFQDTYMIL